MTLSNEDLEQGLEIAAKADPNGEWKACPNPMRGDGVFVRVDGPQQYYPGVRSMDGPIPMDNQAVLPIQVPHNLGKFIAWSNPIRITELLNQIKQMREDIRFTLNAAENLYKPDMNLPEGLHPMFYHTLTFDGDFELIRRTKEIRERYK